MTNDTICAISTAPGVGGIAVIRVSGPQAIDITRRVWHGKDLAEAPSHTAHLGTVIDICDNEQCELDQAVATAFRSPRSFTGEDVVEFSVHGSIYVQQQLVNSLIKAGARLAEPGEFTRRAFAAGKMDLAQAEAVADIIASETKAAHRIATNQMRGAFSSRLNSLREQLLEMASLLELELDFSEEDVEFASRQQLLGLAMQIKDEVDRLAASFHAGSAIKNGIPVAIIGATNAGKSSLLNALLDDDRAIVSDIHGTTRDIVEDTLRIGDYAFRIMDTAGLRDTADTIESIGIERSLRAAQKADIIIIVIDSTDPKPATLAADLHATKILAYNKADLLPATLSASQTPASNTAASSNTENAAVPRQIALHISAKTGQGIDQLKRALAQIAKETESAQSSVLVTNARHYQALLQASASIALAIDAIKANLSGDLIALDLRATLDHLSSIIGAISTPEILSSIFSRFCIGK